MNKVIKADELAGRACRAAVTRAEASARVETRDAGRGNLLYRVVTRCPASGHGEDLTGWCPTERAAWRAAAERLGLPLPSRFREVPERKEE